MTAPLLGTVAVVGFPNVGKSTLVNRLSATREAVVFETPGVTRDRKEVVCEWTGKRFVLVDTGGVDVADPSPITREVAEQAQRAVEEADVVVFVTDARAGITPGDEEIAAILRRSRKPVLLVANKIDDPSRDADALPAFGVSALSSVIISTASTANPSASAAIWRNDRWTPCPTSAAPIRTRARSISPRPNNSTVAVDCSG